MHLLAKNCFGRFWSGLWVNVLYIEFPARLFFFKTDPIPGRQGSMHYYSLQIWIFHAIPSKKKNFWYLIPHLHPPQPMVHDQLPPYGVEVGAKYILARNWIKYTNLHSKIMYWFLEVGGQFPKNMVFLCSLGYIMHFLAKQPLSVINSKPSNPSHRVGFEMLHPLYTGGSRLSRIFWEHANLSGLSVIWLISTNLH